MGVRYLLALIGVLLMASSALAFTPSWRSYKAVTPGGKFVFVMISPSSVEEELRRLNEESGVEIRQLRSTYQRSGMYRNDGSTQPLWTVDWYSNGVQLTPDGVHVIRHGLLTSQNLDVEGVSFFTHGQLLKTHKITDLIDDHSHFARPETLYRWIEKAEVEGEFTYKLTTIDGNQFTFDVRTGEIVSASRISRHSRWYLWLALGVITMAILGSLVWLRKHLKRAEDEET
ncbi:MAG: hypothetical protein ACRC8S_22740 [Fimbriiglobus sp.]